VVNKREDGYHNIHSLFIEIDLADELIFVPANKFSLNVECENNIQMPNADENLISKAYILMHALCRSVPTEYTVTLKKIIPVGAGLGGGSSNAAVALKVLNNLWNLNYSSKDLKKYGAKLGADIPFFIKGGFQLAEGVGEKLLPLNKDLLNDLCFLLVVPNIKISTAKAYESLNKPLRPDNKHSKFAPISIPMDWKLFDNDFEKVIRKTYPEISVIKEKLQNSGALYAGLSGSGSTVFGVFDNISTALNAEMSFSQYQTFLTSPVFHT